MAKQQKTTVGGAKKQEVNCSFVMMELDLSHQIETHNFNKRIQAAPSKKKGGGGGKKKHEVKSGGGGGKKQEVSQQITQASRMI